MASVTWTGCGPSCWRKTVVDREQSPPSEAPRVEVAADVGFVLGLLKASPARKSGTVTKNRKL